MNTTIEEVAQKALECQETCNQCFSACLKEDHVKMMAECMRLDRDCADICGLVASFSSRESRFTKELIQLCAEICQACGDECQKHDHDHCQECAKVCHECAEVCRAYVA